MVRRVRNGVATIQESPKLYPAPLGQRHVALAADHQVIEQPNINEGQRLGHPLGNIAVRLARLAVARRVIVAENHGRGVVPERALDDFPRVDRGAVYLV